MNGLRQLLLASSILILGSCSILEKKELQFKNNVKQIIFFSDEENYEAENSYYDALIELRNRFPNEIKNMLILSSNNAKPYYQAYQIDSCPALLVIYNNEVVVKIIGAATKDEIIKPITDVLITKAPTN